MRTGFNGHIAISWSQTEIDGLESAPLADLVVGAAWLWRGRGLPLVLEGHQVKEQMGTSSLLAARVAMAQPERVINDQAKLEFSNGAREFVAELVWIAGEESPMLIFTDGCPEPEQEFWISAASDQVEPVRIGHPEDGKIVAFPFDLQTASASSEAIALAAE